MLFPIADRLGPTARTVLLLCSAVEDEVRTKLPPLVSNGAWLVLRDPTYDCGAFLQELYALLQEQAHPSPDFRLWIIMMSAGPERVPSVMREGGIVIRVPPPTGIRQRLMLQYGVIEEGMMTGVPSHSQYLRQHWANITTKKVSQGQSTYRGNLQQVCWQGLPDNEQIQRPAFGHPPFFGQAHPSLIVLRPVPSCFTLSLVFLAKRGSGHHCS